MRRAAFVALAALAMLGCGRLRYAPAVQNDAGRADSGEAVDASLDSAAPDDALTDRDGDRIPDTTDLCPDVSDPTQHDEDTDGLGDACDGCPHVASTDQTDVDADGVWDECDPSLDAAHRITTFLTFEGNPIGWTADIEAGGTLTARVEGDAFVLGASEANVAILRGPPGPTGTRYAIWTAVTLESVEPPGSSTRVRNYGLVDQVTGAAGVESALMMAPLDDIVDAEIADLRMIELDGGANRGSINFPEPEIPTSFELGRRTVFAYRRLNASRSLRFVAPGVDLTTGGDLTRTGGSFGLRVRGTTARFEHLVVIEEL
jgi:hypothetical protein